VWDINSKFKLTSNTHKRKNREFNHTENKFQLSPKRCASAMNQHHNSGGTQNLAEVVCIRCVLLQHPTLPLEMSNVSLCKWLHCKRQGCSHSCYHQLRRLLKLSLFRFCDISTVPSFVTYVQTRFVHSISLNPRYASSYIKLVPSTSLVSVTCIHMLTRIQSISLNLRYVSSYLTRTIHSSWQPLRVFVGKTSSVHSSQLSLPVFVR